MSHDRVLHIFIGQTHKLLNIDRLHVLSALLAAIQLVLVMLTHSRLKQRLLATFDHFFDMELLTELLGPDVKGLIFGLYPQFFV